FSSRRRHTRSKRDWSSDVCSSDLIFNATGAEEILHGQFGIGLHLMGGLGMGASAKQGVVSPEFTLYGSQRILAADSSIFPNAPGINPALTIAALSLKAADQIIAAS